MEAKHWFGVGIFGKSYNLSRTNIEMENEDLHHFIWEIHLQMVHVPLLSWVTVSCSNHETMAL